MEFTNYFCGVLLCIGTVLVTQGVLSCPNECSCNGDLVDCSGRSLTSIPYDFPKDARIIRLNDNQIRHVSNDAFYKLDKLQILSLARNKIDDLPPRTFMNTPHLMSLDLSQNDLRYLERDTFKGLNDLLSLSIGDNSIKSVSGVLGFIPNLGSLNVANNELQQISEEDFKSTELLKMLDLSNNRINQVHKDAFKNMNGLRYLFFQNNPLGANLPNLNLTQSRLQLVDFTNCSLARVPQTLPSTVNDLRLSHNNIVIVKETDIRNITKLQLLTLNYNKITNVIYRTFTGLDNLKEIWLSHNKLVYIPRGLPRGLKKLYMDNNLLGEMETSEFKNDSQIEYLSLEMNRIEMIPRGAFDNMKQLKVLDLKANRIKQLKQGTFNYLPSLQYIDLSNNPLEVIEQGTFQDLNNVTKLSMSYIMSTMTDIGDNFLNDMPNVETVELVNSPGLVKGILMHTQKKPFIPLVNASLVNLMYCDLPTLPSSVKEMFPNLKEFLLDGNPWSCDNRILWLKDWMAQGEITFTKGEPVVCERPAELKGRTIWDVSDDNFKEPVEDEIVNGQLVQGGSRFAEVNTNKPVETTTELTTTEAPTTTTPVTTTTEAATTITKVTRKQPYNAFFRKQKGKRRRKLGPNGRPLRRRKFRRNRKNRKFLFKRRRTLQKPTLKNLKIRHPKKKAEQIAKWREQQESEQKSS